MPRPLVVTAPLVFTTLLALACHGPSKPVKPGDAAPTDIKALATFDPAALGPGAPPKPGPSRPLDVLDYGPEGRSEGYGELHVRFNKPVVALELADKTGLEKHFSFDPPLPGTASWKTPDLLVFRPDATLQPCTSYTARFTGGIVDLDGQRFDRPLTWTFETPRPTVTRSLPASLPVRDDAEDPADGDEGEVERRDRVVLVEFDHPVDLQEAQAHITAAARPIGPAGSKLPGKPVAVRVRRPSKKEREAFYGYDHVDRRELVAVQAATLWPGAQEIVVSVTPGLRSESGPLALDTPWSMVFRTYSAQAIVHMGCSVDAPCGLEPITLRLRNPIEDTQLRKITVTPKPKFLSIESHNNWGQGGSDIVIAGQFVPETTYTVHVPASLRDIYGQSIPGGATRSARIAARPTVALSSGAGILRTGKAQTIGVESRHVKSVHVRLGIFTDEEYQQIPAGADHSAIPFPARVLARSYPLTPRGKAEWSSLALDLADLAGNLRRPVLVEVSAAELTDLGRQQPLPDLVRGLFHLTDLGPIATVSLPASSVQVLRLSDGEPVPGATISRPDPSTPARLLQLGVTDRDGMLALPASLLPVTPRTPTTPGAPAARPPLPLRLTIVDPARDDHAHIELAAPYLGPSPAPSPDAKPSPLRPGERLIARVVSERGVYRPGEKVRVVGWSAVDTPFARSNLGRLKAGTPVVFTLKDPFQKEVATHATRTSPEGKFWAELTVPADAALGRYTVTAAIAGDDITARVKVEDYRVPEYTVAASTRRSDILHGETVGVDVHASYYFGGPVQISRVSRSLGCSIQRYRPPGLEDIWSVGEPTARDTRHHNSSGRVVEPTPIPAPTPGHRAFELGCNLDEPRYPVRCNVSVEVQDASMQGIGAEAGFAVHPASFYLALAAPRGWHEVGERGLTIPARAVAIAGERVAVPGATLTITRHWRERSYKSDGGKQVFNGWVERDEPIKTCKQDLPASGPDPTCPLPTLLEGRYELAITASEADGKRVAHTLTSFQVYPKTPKQDYSWRSAPIERLEVLTDKRDVHPGDTVEVAVRGPWPGAHGNLVVARGGIRETHPIVLTDRQHIFTFTVDDTWTPAVYFEASVVEPPGPNQWRPEVEHASAVVRQDFDHRRLKVAVAAPAKAGPGQQVELAVSVRDEQDRPTAARVALWATDEAVLSLTNHEIPDLLPAFISNRSGETQTRDDYRSILYPYIAISDDPWFSQLGAMGHGSGYGSGSGSSMGGRASVAPGVAPPARSRFETTPVFLADLAVDATGEARVKARLPDNLTTFRITAVASARLVDGASPGRFGKNDTLTVVTAPLVLRAALPRQLRPGDTAELAAIVQNNTGHAGRLSVHAKVVEKPGTEGHVLKLMSPETATTEVADGGQARLTFDISAVGPGAPEFELQASLSPDGGGAPTRDGLRLPLPVAAERTLSERVAAYGTISDDQAVAIPIRLPTGVLPGHGGVTVATTSTLLGGLEDAVHTLVQYPYGCIEQTSSRLLPLTVLGPLGRDYPLGIPDTADFMKVGIERILAMQTDSGGFAYWPGGKEVHVYASAYATWVLQLAKKNGHPVPELALGRALDDLERRIGKLELSAIPVDWGYSDGVRVAIALHTLADAGRDTSQQAAALFPLRQRLPLFARAFLLMALHRSDPQGPAVRSLSSELLANIRELQLTAHTGEDGLYELDEFFTSDGRSDAIVLMALLRVLPQHAIVPKLAAGLLERRLGGVWRNTQENAYALVALADYARIYEAELPDFQARAWVAGANILDASFKGRELATRSGEISMAKILNLPRTPGEQLLPVILQRQGQGRLYYRLGAEWAPSQADLPAREQGFSITRTLRTTRGAATTNVAAGEPIAMDITLTSHTRVRYVVLDLPLPAGLEGVSRTLGRGRGAAVLGGSRGWWVSHEEQRPDRVVVFADDLPPGTHHHTVDLRSTSRGAFSFPPALVEAMYMPEVYGRSAGARLTVR
jgi:uncharacterized protein YfaS (alpha-2-macroglobulin family)